MLNIPEIGGYLNILIDKEEKDFIIKNFSENFKYI